MRPILTVNRHADALPVLVLLERAGIDTDVVGESTAFSKAVHYLVEDAVVRGLPGELGQHWNIVVPEADAERARAILVEAGLVRTSGVTGAGADAQAGRFASATDQYEEPAPGAEPNPRTPLPSDPPSAPTAPLPPRRIK